MTTPQPLGSIQVLRAVAVILVVLFHLAPYESKVMKPDLPLIWYFEYFGYGGVNLFFVISGFIICYITKSHWFEPPYWRTYMAKRVWRIYPVYWLCLLIGIAVMSGLGLFGWCRNADAPGFVSNLFLLSASDRNCVLPQAWSLHWEMTFYLVFSLVFLLRRTEFYVACITVIIVSIGLSFAGADWVGRWPHYWGVYNLHFALGAGVSLLCMKTNGEYALTALTTGIVWFLLSGWLNAEGILGTGVLVHRLFEFAASSALIVYGLVCLEKRGLTFPRWMVTIGNGSYSIYLLHLLVLWALRPLAVHADGQLLHFLYIVGAVTLAVIVPLGFHRFVERPLLAVRLPKTQWFKAAA